LVGTVRVFAILLLVWWVLDGPQTIVVGLVAATLGSSLFAVSRSKRSYSLQLLQLPQFVAYFIFESFRGLHGLRTLAGRLRLDTRPAQSLLTRLESSEASLPLVGLALWPSPSCSGC